MHTSRFRSMLDQTSHRPWPLPASRWLLSQRWSDLSFLHWPVPAAQLRPLVHPALQIEERDGTAWVAVTPFRIERMRAGPVPLPPFGMPELNVRTYVTDGERPGVWFLSLDTGSRLAVQGARLTYRLPYVYARMSVRRASFAVKYRSARPRGARFVAESFPLSPSAPAAPGSFDHWCVERYCLYAGRSDSALWTADIHHAPWLLAPASVTIQQNDMLGVHGLVAGGEPAPARLADPLDVVIWPLRKAGVRSILSGPLGRHVH